MGFADIAKITKKRYIAETTDVVTKKDLGDALKARYNKIVVRGELADRLYNEMNGFSSKKQVIDEIVDAIKGDSRSLKKALQDYKLSSYDKGRAILALQNQKKGFKKSI